MIKVVGAQLTKAEVDGILGVAYRKTPPKELVAHVQKNYPANAYTAEVVTNSEYNDEGYTIRGAHLIVYDASGNELAPLPGKSKTAREIPDSIYQSELSYNGTLYEAPEDEVYYLTNQHPFVFYWISEIEIGVENV